ncbi:unnamed protein product [Paramecium sonneborni]|uniref:Uncharacterized protein n=1 Tax=Paramecium sonneborni TaxID=65129 RepID=A0A8S1RUC2_9CILI|nr:unnamed protein product [Paramecium sonneborni]
MLLDHYPCHNDGQQQVVHTTFQVKITKEKQITYIQDGQILKQKFLYTEGRKQQSPTKSGRIKFLEAVQYLANYNNIINLLITLLMEKFNLEHLRRIFSIIYKQNQKRIKKRKLWIQYLLTLQIFLDIQLPQFITRFSIQIQIQHILLFESGSKNFFGKVINFRYQKRSVGISFLQTYEKLLRIASVKLCLTNTLYKISRLQFIIRAISDKEILKNCHEIGIRLKSLEVEPNSIKSENNHNNHIMNNELKQDIIDNNLIDDQNYKVFKIIPQTLVDVSNLWYNTNNQINLKVCFGKELTTTTINR